MNIWIVQTKQNKMMLNQMGNTTCLTKKYFKCNLMDISIAEIVRLKEES
jgi:hypothetical protein